MEKKVLVVDDEETVRKILKLHLSKLGYEVNEAVDGLQALERLRKDDFGLLICNILMPNMDGWQVLREIRSDERTKNIPVIVLTAKDDAEEA